MSEQAVPRWRRITEPTATPKPRAASLAWWGMLLVVATEATLFAVLLSSYFWTRWQTDTGWPPGDIPDPKLLYASLYTGVLLVSAGTMALADVSVHRGRTGVVAASLLATVLLGGAFIGLQVLDWLEKLTISTPPEEAYTALVFTITGAHTVHVVFGMLLLLWVLARALAGAYGPGRGTGVHVAGLYWYFAVAVAVAVYASLILTPYI